MNLESYTLKDLLLTAIKSEEEAKKVYLEISGRAKNFMLQDRLKFLADEEEKHRAFFTKLFKDRFPGEAVNVPAETPVPLPEIDLQDKAAALSELLRQAMAAEKAAHDFYTALSGRYDEDSATKRAVLYMAKMAMGHYRILEIEEASEREFEMAGDYSPMIHVGP